MRKALLTVALATLFGLESPASSATLVTTGSSCVGSVCNSAAGLQSFNSSLGTLTGITLQVETTIQTVLNGFDSGGLGGTATVSSTGPIDVNVNGNIYSFVVSGSAQVPYGAFQTISVDLFDTGSGAFNLNPSLFGSFTDRSNSCFGSLVVGICGSSITFLAPNLQISGASLRAIDAAATSHFTLTYTYTPFGAGVPEPASWAMMLLGFAAVGFSLRRRAARPSDSDPRRALRDLVVS